MATVRTIVLDDEGRIAKIAERTTPVIEALVDDGTGVGIPASSLVTLILTLYRASDLTIINSRNQQNVLNQNGVTVDGSGNLAWTMSAADNVVLGSDDEEPHVALVEWTWGSGRAGKHELLLIVRNLALVS